MHTRICGFGCCTITVTDAVSELVAFLAVKVYVVVLVGVTLMDPPCALTPPMLGEIVAESAPRILHVKVDVCPPWIVVGLAIKNRICAFFCCCVTTRTLADAVWLSVFRTVSRKL